jgi:hypothetical protein
MNLPLPPISVTVRPATIDDLPFIDALQKQHSDRVGFMQTAALRAKIEAGQVLIACADGAPEPLGYVMGADRYFKRDDVGIIYQLNVAPGRQRGYIGATLLAAMFERAAYGCRLFCCWCAQDIEANRFWEAMGFVPLAYRAGSAGKSRVHIFWQRRIRAGDTTTPYWFPSQTTGGSIREDRLVLPIPPDMHWSDAKPLVLPAEEPVAARQLPGKTEPKRPVVRNMAISCGGLRFAAPVPAVVAEPKPKRQKRKNDPRLVSAARELRDRWLERVNADPSAMLVASGKHDVSRALVGPAKRPAPSLLAA